MWLSSVDFIVYNFLGLSGRFADALHFFIYDSVKILTLVVVIIYVISFIQTYIKTETVRDFIRGKSQFVGNLLAAIFGILTPFCSCSSIPLFLGFTQAKIPRSATFSFLISSPMNNEIAIAILFAAFGWKIALIYTLFGLITAIVGGYIIGKVSRDEDILIKVPYMEHDGEAHFEKLAFTKRVKDAWKNAVSVLKDIYIYVIIGISIGAAIHGYVPTDFIVKYTGEDNPFAVLVAVISGIPMYSGAATVAPLIEPLTSKGMLMGTALSFMMAVVALSLPEAMILKKVMSWRLIGLFFGIVGTGIILVGYLFNIIL
ncbi:Transporter [hydrothermal vent metagenome]|uniref:Transporter n=1 Tax=hydrothermal vent metagenome TaxID=652676 RepID=A0A1W1EBR9_9ZZZZ